MSTAVAPVPSGVSAPPVASTRCSSCRRILDFAPDAAFWALRGEQVLESGAGQEGQHPADNECNGDALPAAEKPPERAVKFGLGVPGEFDERPVLFGS